MGLGPVAAQIPRHDSVLMIFMKRRDGTGHVADTIQPNTP